MSDWEEECESDNWKQQETNTNWNPRGTESWRQNGGRGRANRFGDQRGHSAAHNDFDNRPSQGSRGFGRGRGRGGFGQQDSEYRSSSSSWRHRGSDDRSIKAADSWGIRESRGFERNGYSGGDGASSTMMVPCTEVGRIIGRGGQKIKEIQSLSGANIKVQRDGGSYSETPVEISGSEDAIKKAKEIIQELINPTTTVVHQMAGMKVANGTSSQTSEPPPKINWAQIRREMAAYEATKWDGLKPIKKNFYLEKPSVAKMSPDEVEDFRAKNNKIIVENYGDSVQDREIPNPVTKFEEAFDEYDGIMSEIRKAGFATPTPIQCQAWPIALSGLDLIGIAQTGTGKTLAFLLPAFLHIDGQETPRNQRTGPTVLVLSPTRELALQIEEEVKKYHYKGIKSVCIYGGGNRREQIQVVERGVEIVIATPGRLNDLINNEIISVKSVTYLVLDEADRMLDMGFEPEIKKILIDIRPDRQTIMTSATWPPGVQRMADQYMKDPIRVFVGSLDLNACKNVTQLVEMIDGDEKKGRTLEFVQSMRPGEKVIIFVGRKVTADDLASDFSLWGVEGGIQCIHGDREQYDREQALEDFKVGRARVLIATDVASRGLDVKDITYVLNYDFPRHIEDYVHRVGRTGRAGKTGTSLTFIAREDWRQAQSLIEILVRAGQEVPDSLASMAERYEAYKERRNEERAQRGDSGGRGGDGCFKCGEVGHFSRECPQSGGSGRPGGRGGGGRGRGGGGRGRRGRSSGWDDFW